MDFLGIRHIYTIQIYEKIPLSDFFSEGEDGADGHFEVLEAEGNAHDSDAEDDAEEQVQERHLPPSAENPDEIHHNGKASRLIWPVHQFVTERPQRVRAQLEQLHTERNAHDGDAQQQSHDIVDEGDDYAAQDKPEDVSD